MKKGLIIFNKDVSKNDEKMLKTTREETYIAVEKPQSLSEEI